MADAIETICNLFDPGYGYVKYLYPRDNQTTERWNLDPLAKFRECYEIKQISDEHRKLLDSALALFNERSSPLLRYFDHAHVDFHEWFSSWRELIWQNNSVPPRKLRKDPSYDILKPELFTGAMQASRHMVMNIRTCNVYCAILPLAVPNMQRLLAQIGVRMASIYYIETIAKWEDEDSYLNNGRPRPLDFEHFKTIDVLWRRARELCLLETP